jgi:Ca2+-binding EF-hand superfamily protein
MQLVEATRTAKSHAINDRSSRSHCVVVLKQTIKSGNKELSNKFMFVDLAGSERIAKSQVEAMRAAEAKNINTSLSALGRVINALSSSGSKGFVPYRDSALTMLMKESLSGNC